MRLWVSVNGFSSRNSIHVPIKSICLVTSLGVGQIAGGVCLTIFTAGLGVSLGVSLIAEGFGDICFAIQGTITRNLSWKNYAIQKGINLAICFTTLGFSAVKQAATVAWASTNSVSQFLRDTAIGTGNVIKNSATRVGTVAIQGAAASSWKITCKQVVIVGVEVGIREVGNYSTDALLQQILPSLRSVINDEIERIVNNEPDDSIFIRILNQALAADAYYGNVRYENDIEQIVENVINEQENAFRKIGKILGKHIISELFETVNSVRKSSRTSGKTSSGYGNIPSCIINTIISILRTIYKCHKAIDEMEKVFTTIKKKLTELKSKIPTFEKLLCHCSKEFISEETATEIYQHLLMHNIFNGNIAQQESIPDFVGQSSNSFQLIIHPPVQRFEGKLKEVIENMAFIDQKQKETVLILVKKLVQGDQKSFRKTRLRKKIIDKLVNYIVMKLYNELIHPMANEVIKKTVCALSSNIRSKLDLDDTLSDESMKHTTVRRVNIINNDFNQDEIQLEIDLIKKLNDLIESCDDEDCNPIQLIGIIAALSDRANLRCSTTSGE